MTLRLVFAATLLLLARVPARADTADLETAYQRAAEQVQTHSRDYWLDGKPGAERALKRAWNILAEWTAAFLNEHPEATPKRVKRAAPGGDLDIVPLGPRTILVSAQVRSAFGTVFIVDGSDGPYRPVWSIRDRSGSGAFSLLEAWSAKGAEDACRISVGDANWSRCGSLYGRITRLPNDAQGCARFYVLASYTQEAGNTELMQLSFWTWTGTRAEPERVTTFSANIDDVPIRRDGDVLTVRVGDNYRMFLPDWDHYDRPLDWKFRIGGDRIEDLGRTPLAPELETVDEMLFRVAHGQPANDLATPDVLAQAAKSIAQSMEDTPDLGASLGMVHSALQHQDGNALVCFELDSGPIIQFTIERREGGLFISSMSEHEDVSGGCPKDKS